MEQFPATNPNPVLSVGNDGSILYSNAAGEPLLHEWSVRVGDKLPSYIGELVQRVISRNRPEKMEVKARNRVFLVAFHPLPAEECVNIYGFDISEQKELEEKLRKSEAKYRNIVETANEGIWVYDTEIKFTYVNQKMADMLGYSRDEIIGRFAWDFMDDAGKEIARKSLEKRRQGLNDVHEFKLIRKDGSPLWVLVSAKALFDDEGKFTGALSMYTDITERKQSEASLAESERRFRLALRNAPVSLSAQDRDLRFIWAYNQRSARQEEIIGKFDTDLFTPEETARLTAIKQRVLEENVEVREKMWFDRPNGRMFLDVCFEPLRDEAGTIIGVSTATVDLTPMKKAEEALQQAYENLQVQSEELQAQSEKLEAQSEELQVQSEELQEAYEALRESEERYRMLFTNMTESFALTEVVYDEDGRPYDYCYLEVNPAYALNLGVQRKDLLGRNMLEVFPRTTPTTIEKFRETALTGQSTQFEVFSLEANKYIDIYAFCPERGKLAFIFRDISAHKIAEEALQRERSLLESVMQATDVMLVLLDPQFNFIWVNPAYAETCQMKTEEMVGKNHFALYPHEENEAIFRQVRDTGKGVFYKDKPFVFPDQPERGVTYWDWSLAPVKGSGGDVTGLVFSLRETTKYKQVEEAIKESEEKYRSLFSNMSEGFGLHEIILDADGKTCDYRFLEMNDAFEKLTGISREQALGRTVKEVLPGVDNYWIETYGRVALTGEAVHYENYSTPLKRWYEFYSYSPKENQFAVMFIDITERKDAEEALRESEARRKVAEVVEAERRRLNSVLDMLPVYVVLLNEDYRVPFANRFFEERFGKSEGKCCYEYLFQRTEPCEDCETYKALKTGAPHRWEWTGPDGRHYDIYDYPFKDSNGSTLIMEVGIDITEIKQAQSAVREERQRLFEVLETLPALICLLTADHHVAFVNRTFREKFGESGGRHCYDYCFGLNKPCEFCEAYQVLETGQPHNWEVATPDGTVLDVYNFPFTDVDGSQMILEMNIDITARKKAEDTLKLKLEELSRSNAELEQFAYVSSHDLQEPLRMISSYLQLLQRRYQGKLDDKADRYIYFAVDGASRMQNLINDLLEFSRVATRAREPEPTDCEFLLIQALSNLDLYIKENKVTVSHDSLPEVMADSTQLIQVFQNLITNGIKFNTERAPKIHISAEKKDNNWVFSVQDNGIGINPQYFEKIFEVFKRLHKKEEYPGTGIGLAICKKIVERHYGHIWVESEPGTGSTFYFSLPINNEKSNLT
jgi:PAS domain S-box-containing protein